tara:strand:+ start:6643 stop:7305 length:663 start_codon:yes stop_codon:yes gene_type:complete
MSLEWTGERVVPGKTPRDAMEMHRRRYEAIVESCQGKKVLDIPCGSGYGSELLVSCGACAAAEVHGVDSDADTIIHAAKTYQDSGLYFHLGDMREQQGLGLFDVVACFEGIEHVELAEAEDVLQNFLELLRPDGWLFISTPNKDRSQSFVGEGHFHKFEMTWLEFEGLISRRFKVVQRRGQFKGGEAGVIHFDPRLSMPDVFFIGAQLLKGMRDEAGSDR